MKVLLKEVWELLMHFAKRLKEELVGIGALLFGKFLLNTQAIDTFTSYGMAFLVLVAILKVVIGLKTPFVEYLPKTKAEKVEKVVGDDDYLYDKYNDAYVKFKLERIFNIMKERIKNFFKWLYINKFTLMGFMAFILYALDNYFKWSEKLKLSEEWYYGIIAFLFVLIGNAIRGRGLEKLGLIQQVIGVYEEYKANKTIAKEQAKALKEKSKYQPVIDIIKEELKKDLQKTNNGSEINIK